jgi:hypothetical protein
MYLQQTRREGKRIGRGFRGVERKSVSVYQYCRYPAKWLNHRDLHPPVSRGFRFCLRRPAALVPIPIRRAWQGTRMKPGFRELL